MKYFGFINWNNFSPFFIAALIFHFCFIGIGWNHSLSDVHGFRQSQTALTSLFFLKEGFTLEYITPICGPPWTIPFEFPLYQYFVFQISNLTQLPIEISGRCVSLLFFYGLLIYVFKLGKDFSIYPPYLVSGLVLIHPIYLFWSRTILIESTALFFCFSFFYHSVQLFHTKNFVKELIIIGLLGTIGSLVKVTTFAPCMLGTIVYFALIIPREEWKSKLRLIGFWLAIVMAIICIQYLWVKHTDHLKSASYIGNMLTSSRLGLWNFGTWDQRLEWGKWKDINIQSSDAFFSGIIACLLGLFVFKNPKTKKTLAAFCIMGFLGPAIFLNLYFVHEYYHYANVLFFLMVLGVFIPNILSKKIQWAILLVLASLFIFDYQKNYLEKQSKNNLEIQSKAKLLTKILPADSDVIVLGMDWNSELAFYMQRKLIGVPEFLQDEFYTDTDAFISKLNLTHRPTMLLMNNAYTDPKRRNSIQEWAKENKFQFANYPALELGIVQPNSHSIQ